MKSLMLGCFLCGIGAVLLPANKVVTVALTVAAITLMVGAIYLPGAKRALNKILEPLL